MEFILRRAGHQVISVDNASDALRELESRRIDIVLTDYVMPEMSGLELLARVKSKYPDVPVAIMSGYFGSDDDRKKADALGLDALISKSSFKFDELLTLVERLCANTGRRVPHALVTYLEDQNARLKESLAEQVGNTDHLREYCTYLAHSLKGEFMNMASSVGRIQKCAPSQPPIHEECLIIRESIGLSQIMLRRLVDFLGVAKPRLVPIVFEELAERFTSLAKPRLPAGVVLNLHMDEAAKGKALQGELEQILGVLLELVHNASKALRENGGHIEVEFGLQAQSAVLVVRDDGPGIPHKVRSELFQRQVRSSGGMGLGLYLSAKVISTLGGELKLSPADYPGTTITITLPLAPSDDKR